jgi:hypothetical protein
VCDLETSRIGAPYIFDISNLRVNLVKTLEDAYSVLSKVKGGAKEYSDRLTQFSDQRYDNFCNRPQIIANLKI